MTTLNHPSLNCTTLQRDIEKVGYEKNRDMFCLKNRPSEFLQSISYLEPLKMLPLSPVRPLQRQENEVRAENHAQERAHDDEAEILRPTIVRTAAGLVAPEKKSP